ncbi:hypothetical protein [Hymenobacter bucti]|uniref:Uncharacterized protein n=1 Tax=Hymenobacter bucti TaxID=1844114 RepID=A0ABW4QNY0_9BACT
MHQLFRFPILSSVLLGAGLLLSSPAAHAQLTVPATLGYDFLTMTTIEGTKAFSAILFSPAFQGKTEMPLIARNVLSAEKYKELIRQNTELVNGQLSALTVAGWELVQVYTPSSPAEARCYLFRKAKS